MRVPYRPPADQRSFPLCGQRQALCLDLFCPDHQRLRPDPGRTRPADSIPPGCSGADCGLCPVAGPSRRPYRDHPAPDPVYRCPAVRYPARPRRGLWLLRFRRSTTHCRSGVASGCVSGSHDAGRMYLPVLVPLVSLHLCNESAQPEDISFFEQIPPGTTGKNEPFKKRRTQCMK